jgi:hypothetical protein
MTVESPSLFARVIQDHLELKERNAELEARMPLGRYKAADPFDNHPLFKSEEQARLEETMDGEEEVVAHAGALVWAAEESPSFESDDSGLWSRSRDFDWGD